MNDLPAKNLKLPTDSVNTPVAIATIVMVGIFALYKTHVDAKYNRQTVCAYDATNKSFVFSSQPTTVNNTSVCPA